MTLTANREKRIVRLWVRLTQSERMALEEKCKAVGETVSDAVRRALMEPADVARDLATLRSMCGDLTLRLQAANKRAMRVLGLESENKKIKARLEKMEAER